MAFILIYPTDNTDTNTSTRTEFWLSVARDEDMQSSVSKDGLCRLVILSNHSCSYVYLDCATQDLSETWFSATICNVELHTRKVMTMHYSNYIVAISKSIILYLNVL